MRDRLDDVQRQCAEARPVRRQLLVGPLRHQGAGALVGELGGLPRARQAWATRPASTSCCRSAAGRATAATPTCTARRSRPSPGRPACSPPPRASPCSAPCTRRCFIRSSPPSRSSPPTTSARAASASTSSPAGTRASSRCSACSSASTRRATPTRRSGSTPSSWPGRPDDDFDFDGEHIKLKKVRAKPKPYGGTRPLIMNAGSSGSGQAFALRNCDAFFTATSTSRQGVDATAKMVQDIKAEARAIGREIEVFIDRPDHLPPDPEGGGGLLPPRHHRQWPTGARSSA